MVQVFEWASTINGQWLHGHERASSLLQIKVVDSKTKQCRVLAGTGKAGNRLGPSFLESSFNEPGGLCLGEGGKLLYVADTNNNCIKVLDLETKTVSLVSPHMWVVICQLSFLTNWLIVFGLFLHQFPIQVQQEVDSVLTTATSSTPAVRKLPKSATVHTMPSITVSSGQSVTLLLKLALPTGTKLTEEAPSFWSLSAEGTKSNVSNKSIFTSSQCQLCKACLFRCVFFAPCTLFLWGSSVGWTIVFCLLDYCVHTFSAGFRDQLAILGDDPRINRQFLYASQHTVNPSFYLSLPISLSFFSIIISASPSVRLLQHLSFLLSFLSVLLHKNVNPARKHIFHDW